MPGTGQITSARSKTMDLSAGFYVLIQAGVLKGIYTTIPYPW